MSKTALIGKSKELYVATLLVTRHLHVYFPLVDNGFDLVVTSTDGRFHVPVQVKYKESRTGLTLHRDDAEKFRLANAVLAFGSGSADVENFYFIPAREWCERAEDRARGDNKLAVYFSEDKVWADQYLGNAGIDRSFASVLGKT
ncbi:hypothetical protein NYO99_21290 [Pelomonas sp. UHG3]|uniref:Uncharacterized protein n=1 Tax=Roseateles hydrophilus TaxID=2975054 RepID=A0ACC6CGH7_9BURK|nr:hypothetical protein [Pelomonas sp. UHG3]MCY4747514.1 hypothetical protein [Pelomonas sp. UHG3]